MKTRSLFPRSVPRRCVSAFSLLELLAVVSITMVLMVVSGPSISALSGVGGVNKAAADLAGALELARSQAMSRQTFVRVALADIAPGSVLPEGGVVVLVLSSADGTLVTADSASMSDSSLWPALGRPMVFRNLEIRDELNAGTPDTAHDSLPSGTNLTAGTPVRRVVSGLGEVSFTSVVQFDPTGQACVLKDIPARQVKIALDKRGALGGKNPVIIRLSGHSGGVRILRAGDGIP
jgi:type II secretory pathway pseudopilin PulG